MILSTISFLLTVLLKLRYRIHATGLSEIKRTKNTGILFLPNHPAYIDPFILYRLLLATKNPQIHPRVLIDEIQANRPGVGFLLKQINGLKIPPVVKNGNVSAIRKQIDSTIDCLINSLKRGEDVLIYPAGRVYRSKDESIGGSSAVAKIVEAIPEIDIVLIRTSGLWGSSLSYAQTSLAPNLGKLFWQYLQIIIFNFLFFIPKREVNVEFCQKHKLPVGGTRAEINQYLTEVYKAANHEAILVPYYFYNEGKEYGHI